MQQMRNLRGYQPGFEALKRGIGILHQDLHKERYKREEAESGGVEKERGRNGESHAEDEEEHHGSLAGAEIGVGPTGHGRDAPEGEGVKGRLGLAGEKE